MVDSVFAVLLLFATSYIKCAVFVSALVLQILNGKCQGRQLTRCGVTAADYGVALAGLLAEGE